VSPATDSIQRHWKALLKKLASAYPAPPSDAEHPPAPVTVIASAVHATMLWEASQAQADAALQQLTQHFADHNDMRVALPSHLIHAIGPAYPLAVERVLRLKSWLSDLYRRSTALDLEYLRDRSKADARRELESLHGLPGFAAAHVVASSLGGHAVPIDDRLLALLKAERIGAAHLTSNDAMELLETVIRPDELSSVLRLLRAWSDLRGVPPRHEEAPAFQPLQLAPLSPLDRAAKAALGEPASGKRKAAPKRSATKSAPRPRPSADAETPPTRPAKRGRSK
jgi:hypothetical protein